MTLQDWFSAHPRSNCKLYDTALWTAAQEAMRARAAHVANEWVVACDHAGEIQQAIEALPIE